MLVSGGVVLGIALVIGACITLQRGSEDVARKVEGLTLTTVWRAWVKDGKPEKIDLRHYIGQTTSRLSVQTNRFHIAGVAYQAKFGIQSERFARAGILVITEDGQFLWIDDERGASLVDVRVSFH